MNLKAQGGLYYSRPCILLWEGKNMISNITSRFYVNHLICELNMPGSEID